MQNRSRRIYISFLMAWFSLAIGVACAAIPQTINYQGYLTNAGGTAVNTSVSMTFSLYNAATGGAALYSETQASVSVANGSFNAVIGVVSPIFLPFDVPYWISVAINSDPEMSPRQPLSSSPYAFRASSLASTATIDSSQIVGSSALRFPVNGSQAGSDKIMFDWGYNNIKAGIGYKPNPAVYGSDMYFHLWDTTDSFIFGRDDPFYFGGQYFTEWMRLKNNGNLGIGTNNPTSKLHVVGNIKMVDSNQALGKVLTSDASGLGSWQALPAVAATQQLPATPCAANEVPRWNGSAWACGTTTVSTGWTQIGPSVYNSSLGGYVGIGTTTPGFPLNFSNSLGDKISLYGATGNHYGFGVQSSLLQVHTDAAGSDIAFGYGRSGDFIERMRIFTSGTDGMRVRGRLLLANGSSPLDVGQTGGAWLFKPDNSALLAFMGTQNDQNVGFFGGPGQWGFIYDAVNSRVGIGNSSPNSRLAFAPALEKKITLYPGGTGDVGMSVSGNQLNLYADNANARVALGLDDFATGFKRLAYASDSNQKFTVEGFISVAGIFTQSDSVYKQQIETIPDALNSIVKLRGTSYLYKTKEFPEANFSDGKQLGLIAQEVEKVFPELVANNADGYKSVNYPALIPVLIESIKELKKQLAEKNDDVNKLIAEFAELRTQMRRLHHSEP